MFPSRSRVLVKAISVYEISAWIDNSDFMNQKKYFRSKRKKVNKKLKLTILIFWTKFLQKMVFLIKIEKSEQHHWILHIQIRLVPKF